MRTEFKLPDPGEGIHEVEVLELAAREGDHVAEGDLVLVVETDKAANEIAAPADGTIAELRVAVGDVVEVGSVLFVVTDEDGQPAPSEVEEDKPEATTAGAASEETEQAEDPHTPSQDEDEAEPSQASKEAPSATGVERPVPATPSTRRVARELGVDLRSLPRGGEDERVTEAQVRAAAAEGPARERAAGREDGRRDEPGVAAPDAWGPVEHLPLDGVRQAITRQVVRSWQQVPHVLHEDVADITQLETLRQDAKACVEPDGGRLTLTVLLLKALALGLKAHERFNASVDAENGQIVLKRYYHIGVAMDTERGLVVPVLRDVDRKSLRELSVELEELIPRVRGGRIERDELKGGSCTLTNVGPLGGTGLAPLVRHPEVAMLGVARARLVSVVEGSLREPRKRVRLRLPLALAFDHRAADGADAARFLRDVIGLLEDPKRLVLEL